MQTTYGLCTFKISIDVTVIFDPETGTSIIPWNKIVIGLKGKNGVTALYFKIK